MLSIQPTLCRRRRLLAGLVGLLVSARAGAVALPGPALRLATAAPKRHWIIDAKDI